MMQAMFTDYQNIGSLTYLKCSSFVLLLIFLVHTKLYSFNKFHSPLSYPKIEISRSNITGAVTGRFWGLEVSLERSVCPFDSLSNKTTFQTNLICQPTRAQR